MNARVVVDVVLGSEERDAALAADAAAGLRSAPKVLSPVWFYDERGSELFDAITRLPEYYLTRAERRLLEMHAAEIATRTGATSLVELGSGTSEKTRILLDALVAGGTLARYVPLDVSEETLRAAATALHAEYPDLVVHGVVGDFHRHLGQLPADGRRLIAFLGSTIGNLTPAERRRFFFDLDCVLGRDEWFLLGVDLEKARGRLLSAYDDAAGVTAAFNRNALHVLNDRLGADFDPSKFEHVAVWNDAEHRVEMHLRSTMAQRVFVKGLDLEVMFAAGESLRTEISTKFTAERLASELWDAGFVVEQTWTDDDFLLVLSRPFC